MQNIPGIPGSPYAPYPLPNTVCRQKYLSDLCPFSLSLISVRILALPSPGVFTHLLQASLSYPVKLIFRLCSVAVAGSDIACTAGLDLVGDLFAACLAECFHHIKYGVAVSCSQVIYGNAGLLFQLLYCADMSDGKVDHVDVVTYSGSVRCIIIIAEDAQAFQFSDGNLCDIWDQVVRDSLRILSDETALMSSDRIEVTEQDHVPSPAGKTEWSRATIQNMLHNEKYVGDLLLQKTYTADFLTKTVKKNRGEVEQYYVRNNHPAIIPRDIFQAVQLEMARRGSKTKINPNKGISGRSKYSGKFALTERLICGECGCMYRRVLYTNRDGSKTRVWRCTNRLENGKRFCKHSPTLKETELQKALMRCIATLLDNKESVKEDVMQAEKNILRYEGAAQDPRQLIDRIQEIDCQTSSLLLLVARSEDASIYERKFKALKEGKQALQTELESLQRTSQMDATAQDRIQKVLDYIWRAPADFTQYDDDLVRRIVEQVIVYSKERVVVKFVGGYSVEMVIGN